ncbi:MAG TPA: hypothetical protein VK175_07070 [Leadbetterella sp.]|nr:hypothetical protein [Leadbetterella sp.]
MSKKKIVQIISIVFLVIAVLLLIPNTNWKDDTSVLGFISLVCGTLGSIISIFIPTTYTFMFIETDWKKDVADEGFCIIIPSKKHGLGNSPQTQTFLKNKMNTYEEVGVASNHDENGNVTIGATLVFEGKAIIK